ncbi:MAG: DUF3881 family protein [Lachnospiraceae bacterium]|nr:DUF3881 family protein [Lachnospiraceae bacterium]
MHKFLRAVGIPDEGSQKLVRGLLKDAVTRPSSRSYITDRSDDSCMLAEYRLELGPGFGLCAFGSYDEDGSFYLEYYFPYLRRDYVSTTEDVTVEERLEDESFACVCDDLKVGVTLIFRLQNTVDYLKRETAGLLPMAGTSVSLSALSTEGTIMLPIQKSASDRREKQRAEQYREGLMNKARTGDEAAMKDLTISDMDTYAVILDKIQDNDIYSLVDSHFMPTGVECDLYNVMGEIHHCEVVQNRVTGQELYRMVIDCNELYFDLLINKKDLCGEPAVGRRFKGVIWLQGRISFPDEGEIL